MRRSPIKALNQDNIGDCIDAKSPSEDAGHSVWPESIFERIFLQNYARVASIIFRLVGDQLRAEELAGEVFWKLYRRRLSSGQEDNLGGWLYRAAVCMGLDFLRADKRRRKYESEAAKPELSASAQISPIEEILREEKRRKVRAALVQLKPAQARLLILRSSGLSYKELAEALGVKTGSIGTLLARAEAEFERHYRELYSEE